MGHMAFENTKPYEDYFWQKNNIDLVFDHVERVDTNHKSLQLKSGSSISYDTLIIATGSRSNTFGWPGQEFQGVQCLYSYHDLLRMEANTRNTKQAVIVGGGLIGIEMAEMLLSRNISVTFLVREAEYWSNILPLQDANLISRHIRSHHVELKLLHELQSIQADENGRAKSIVTNTGEVINCQFVGLTVGVSPNIEFLHNSGIKTKTGILVDEYLQTNVPEVYALGDCVERTYELPGRKSIEQVWYTGRMMGEVVAQTICGEMTKYEPGPWFNSAKFFNIEYQTYGAVWPTLQPDEEEFYWEHASGLKAIHFVWRQNSGQFLGINCWGIRLRHECFDRWLREKKDIAYVVEHLVEANFDPEFFTKYEPEILRAIANKIPVLE